MRTWSSGVAGLLFVAGAALGQGGRSVDFEKDIRPILHDRCLSCHGPEKQRGGLRLDRKAPAFKGGDSGPAIKANHPGDSLLVQKVKATVPAERMPPSGPALSREQIQSLETWIEQGAAWPEGEAVADRHWSFQTLAKPKPPSFRQKGWVRNPIDAFILAKLEQQGLSPNGEAEAATLLRRLSFDLIGLPPSPDDLDGIRAEDYERSVERFLKSPQIGEKWARHWLDVVRFAESDGFETNQPRPNAWPYRDYVIRAFNDDVPYDRFIKEQLAGDALGADAATGFLVGGPFDRVKSPDPVLTAQQRADELHDMLSTTASTFLGLTVGCARCHSHKFDPIAQTDYFAMLALLSGVQHGERPIANTAGGDDHSLAAKPGTESRKRRPAVQTGANVDRFEPRLAKLLRFTIRGTNNNAPCLDELEVFSGDKNIALAAQGTTVAVSGSLTGNPKHKPEHLNDGKYGNSQSWISSEAGKGWVVLEFPASAKIDRVVWSRDRTVPPMYKDRVPTDYLIETSLDGRSWQTVASSADRAASSAAIYAGRMTPAVEMKRLHRGDVTQPRERIGPGVLASIEPRRVISEQAGERERRLALAEWIADAKNPLTARVIVNRLWQYHFGVGLVETPSDFGKNGARPSHPELLDWLACELIEHQWSLRHMHRLIVTSATFRQSSRASAEGLNRDAQSRLLWRFPPRRLEAEALRDTILAVSGKLDRRMGGPGFDLFEPNTNYVKVYNPRKEFGPDTFRRMVYQSKWRMQLDDTFGAFDCPDGGQIAPRRSSSTTPLQALNLLNSPFLVQQSGFFAERLQREEKEIAAQIRLAFRLAFARAPASEESAAARELIEKHGLSLFCRALFNANEFVSVR